MRFGRFLSTSLLAGLMFGIATHQIEIDANPHIIPALVTLVKHIEDDDFPSPKYQLDKDKHKN